MTRILLFTFLFFFSIYNYSQERNDGFFVVHIMETDAQDLKCEIGISNDYIKSLPDKGRHIISVVPTKFGSIVLHKKSETKIAQKYIRIPSYMLKKEAKKLFAEGYSVEYYNEMSNYGIFSKNPAIVEQKYLGQITEKKIKKYNKKGIYAICGSSTEDIGHNNIYGIAYQERKFYIDQHQFASDFEKMAKLGYIVRNVGTFYNKYGNSTSFTVIYDKPQQDYKGKQAIGIFETKEDFIAFLNKYVKEKCNIKGIWGGWENRDYAAEEARLAKAKSESESGIDILLGLGNSILQLTNGEQSSSEISHDTDYDTNSKTNPSNSKAKTGKCKYCGGTGNCSAKSSAGRKNACNGSGLCGHCNGTGWIKAGGSEAKCTACNGTGKCKSCNGTGKCSHCHGTGK